MQIKIRGWDKEAQRMLSWKELNELDKGGLTYIMEVLTGEDKNVIPMLYSTFKDRMGTEVYDEDILLVEGQDTLLIVEFNDGAFCAYNPLSSGVDKLSKDRVSKLLKVGDRYSTPELYNKIKSNSNA